MLEVLDGEKESRVLVDEEIEGVEKIVAVEGIHEEKERQLESQMEFLVPKRLCLVGLYQTTL